MTRSPARAATWAWALLVAATLSAWLLTEDARDGRLATVAVLLIAAFKMHMVVSHFMEVPWTARPWRQVLAAWILFVTIIVLGGYAFAIMKGGA